MTSFFARLGIEDYRLRLIVGRTKITYDPVKEERNRKEKKFSLESAAYLFERRLFHPEPILALNGPFKRNGEFRYEVMTLDDNKNVLFFVVTQKDDETIRIISFRQADKKEAEIYSALTLRSTRTPPALPA